MTSFQYLYNNYYRCFAKIDLKAIEHNFNEIKKCLNKGVKALAVVKANAYGHGSVEVAERLESLVDYFGVAGIDEAITLRQNGINKPILVLTYTSPYRFSEVIDYDITATVYNPDEAKELSKVAVSKNKLVKVHIAVDTGMGRVGFTPDESSADIVKEISLLRGIEIEGLISHYACADARDKTTTAKQTELFDKFIGLLEKRNVNISIKHICNSAGAIELEKQYDMCRIGIALYGLYPSDEVNTDKIKLIPAMEVISHVIHVKDVPQGFKIGYGHTYEAPADRKIATVSIGYADGYNRCFTNVGYVLINGKKAPVVGRVCMDQIMVDVTDIENVTVGDHAVILGASENERITAEILGKMSNSINYEVVCNFSPRVKRLYVKD